MKSLITQIESCFKSATIKDSIVVCLLLISVSFSSSAQITRTQIMNNAYSFSNASYSWTATASNKWSGTYSCGRYIYYASPSYGGCVITGTNWGMPYAWGGWSTIAQHNTAMSNGKSAGDICSGYSGGCTNSPGGAGLSCVSGDDCSGGVTNWWQLGSKYNCSMLDGISTATTPSLVQQGDIYNSSGHVRLVSSYSSSTGNTTVVESSGRDWRTSYYTYTPAQLSGYTPRVYNVFICNAPTSPYVSSITASTATFNWTSTGAVSYNYYIKKSTASTWTLLSGYSYKPVTLGNLSAGTTYNFMVSSNCGSSSSNPSSVVTFTTASAKNEGGFEGSITVSDGNITAGIGEEQNAISQVSIFPNPVKIGQEISLEGLPEKVLISIYTVDGKLMFTKATTNGSVKLKLPTNLPASIYIVNLKSDNGFNENKRLVMAE